MQGNTLDFPLVARGRMADTLKYPTFPLVARGRLADSLWKPLCARTGSKPPLAANWFTLCGIHTITGVGNKKPGGFLFYFSGHLGPGALAGPDLLKVAGGRFLFHFMDIGAQASWPGGTLRRGRPTTPPIQVHFAPRKPSFS